MLTQKQLSEVVKKAKLHKSTWTSHFWEVFAYTQPDRNYIYRSSKVSSSTALKQIPLYTSVGKTGCDIFVNRIQTALAPINKDFIRFNPTARLSAQDKEDLDPLCVELSRAVNQAKQQTNLDEVLHDCFYDLVAGTGIIFRNNTMDGVRYEKVRLDAVALGTEQHQTVVREFNLCARDIGIVYPELFGATRIGNFYLNDSTAQEQVDLQDVLYFNEANRKWEYYLRKDEDVLLHRVYETSPYYIFHWSRSSDMPFGDGVGSKALPNIKRINSYIKCSLELMPFAFPMFVASEGALFSNDLQYKPGAIITVRGDPNQVVPINMQTQKANFQLEIDKEELQVKQIMLDYTLPTDPRQMTAAEVYARTSRTDEQIYGNVSLLTNVIKQIALDIAHDIYYQQGLHDALSMEWQDFIGLLDVEIINQTSQDQELINRINAYISNVQFDPTAIWQGLKRSETLDALGKAYNIPSTLRNNAEEIDELVQEQLESQAQQQEAITQQNIGAQMMINASKKGA